MYIFVYQIETARGEIRPCRLSSGGTRILAVTLGSSWRHETNVGGGGRMGKKSGRSMRSLVAMTTQGLVVSSLAAVMTACLSTTIFGRHVGRGCEGRLLERACLRHGQCQLSRGTICGCDACTTTHIEGIGHGVEWRDPGTEDGYFRRKDKVGKPSSGERGDCCIRTAGGVEGLRLHRGGEVAQERGPATPRG